MTSVICTVFVLASFIKLLTPYLRSLSIMSRLPPLNSLRIFTVAAQHKSFTLAAEQLHVTQGAVSRQVKLLEDWLGKNLFHRQHQSLELTEDGKVLAAGLEQAFLQMERTVNKISKIQTNQRIAINIPPTFATRLVAPRLKAFQQRFPTVDLSITNDAISQIRSSQHLDCLIVFSSVPWEKCDCELLMWESHVAVASPALWENSQAPTPGTQTLLHILNGEERLPVWENWLAAAGLTHIESRPGIAFSTLDQAINAATTATGLAVVDSAMIQKELENGQLQKFSDVELTGPYGYWFISLHHDPAKEILIKQIQQWFVGLCDGVDVAL
ncbi:LysR family transcriptional regulator [Glaciimonas soli]|uniref:LysR family transcriptional regulator n=1 Tax=Glaciimonas soli TaxID=2590999 RepID=A0A843YZK8_9BURK|nr:LysR family transcriptional regulator [Glaciimonas soli]MQR02662.1 LysR family transcriptional regulator [Glaciimonas soli]